MPPLGAKHDAIDLVEIETLGHVRIEADRETVFRYFTDSGRWAAWWGAGSTIDPRPGGGGAGSDLRHHLGHQRRHGHGR